MSVDILTRARRYLDKLPPSVQGQGGDEALRKAAYTLTKGFSLGEEEALPLLCEFNERAAPPWDEAALVSKLRSAARSPGPSGYLLEGAPRPFVSAPAAPAKPKPENPKPPPTLHRLTVSEIHRIAELRGLSPEAVALGDSHGIIAAGMNRGVPAWFLRGGGVLQAKTFSGELWTFKDGKRGKADTIGGVHGFGIQVGTSPRARTVILSEGLPSALEVIECLLRADAEAGAWHEGVALVAAYSAESRIPRELAEYLAARRVLIVADGGDTGLEAAKRWRAVIRAFGAAEVSAFAPEAGDLGNALRASPRCPEFIRQFLAA